MKNHFVFIPTLFLSGLLTAKPLFIEKSGIIAIEAESTSSRLDNWVKKTDVANFKGECHLEFTGNRPENGPPESPLEYEFEVKKGGVYHLTLRARKRLETSRQDISNDCYVSVEGDFEQADGAPLEILRKPTKMYGGHASKWAWATKLDANHKKFAASYTFKPEETYTLTVHGRSKNFNLDRILFVHEDVGLKEAHSKNPKENKSEEQKSPSRFKARVERTLTNQQGQSIKAQLISKTEDTVTILTKGRQHTLQLDTLSQEDQLFIAEWQP